MKSFRLMASVFTVAFAFATTATAQQGIVTANMRFGGIVGCDIHPAIPFRIDNVPFRATGQAVLGQDRKASMDLTIAGLLAPTRIRLNATLGAAPRRVPGGSAELNVISENELRMVWHLRTSSVIVNVRMSGQSCSMSVDSQLRPGESKYSMYDGRTTHSCAKPQYTDLSCGVR